MGFYAYCWRFSSEFWPDNHLGEFPIGSYLKVKDSTKKLVPFLVLVRRFFSYNLKTYLYAFILSRGVNFLGAPCKVKNFKFFFGFKAILGHEGGTLKIKAMVQNKGL